MNEFVNKFRDPIDKFYDSNSEVQNKLLIEILNYANQDSLVFRKEIKEIQFDKELMALPIVLEALSKDTNNWGQYFVDLLDDILVTAKQSKMPNSILENLSEYAYIETVERPFVQKIVDRFYRELDAETLEIKLASIWMLTYFLDNKSIKNKSSIISKLQQQLYDRNWKVRVTAFKALGYEKLLPEGHRQSLKDKLAKLIFKEPPII